MSDKNKKKPKTHTHTPPLYYTTHGDHSAELLDTGEYVYDKRYDDDVLTW